MKTGDEILVHNPFDWRSPVTYISWLIRKICGVYYNHSAIVVTIYEQIYIVEAVFPHVIITEYSEWRKKAKRTITINPIKSKFTESQLRHRILAQVGKKYDWWSLIMIIRYLVTGRWNGRTGTKAAEKLYCFELVAYVHDNPEYWKIIPKK